MIIPAECIIGRCVKHEIFGVADIVFPGYVYNSKRWMYQDKHQVSVIPWGQRVPTMWDIQRCIMIPTSSEWKRDREGYDPR